jgi:hypothetical protein
MSDDLQIISVDVHIVEPPHLWQDRLPTKLGERGPRVSGPAGVTCHSPTARPSTRR